MSALLFPKSPFHTCPFSLRIFPIPITGRRRLPGFGALGVVILARFGLAAQSGVGRCQGHG